MMGGNNMVRFEKDKIVVEMSSRFPASDWAVRVRNLVYAISAIDKDRVDNDHDCIYGLCELLLEMLPDEKYMTDLMKANGID